MINIQTPANALYFLRLMKKIVNAELLNPDLTTSVWFDFEKDEKLISKIKENNDKDHLLNDHLVDMGFGINAVINIGGIFISLVIYVVLCVYGLLLFTLTKILGRIFPNHKKKAKTILDGQYVKEKLMKDMKE
jgi:hypothetical protein